MRFGSAVRVSVRVAAALEDLIKGDRDWDWDWDNRKDAAFERRILFFFLRGERLDFLWW